MYHNLNYMNNKLFLNSNWTTVSPNGEMPLPVNIICVQTISKRHVPYGKAQRIAYCIDFIGTPVVWFYADQESRDLDYDLIKTNKFETFLGNE